jgi:UDP-N-acetylmuramyl pentapeptide phosphotransferase/UDP-N-acetylglucosamine-1-phosphate transferase
MLKQMKQTIGILLAVCFLISVTAATVSAHGPVMVKEKKTAVLIFQHVKTKIFMHHHKWSHHHHHMWHHHHHHKLMKAIKEFMDS